MISSATAPSPTQAAGTNVDVHERDWLLTAGGATLLFLALSKRSTIGLAAALGGGYLLYRSYLKGNLPNLLPDSLHLPDALGALCCGSSCAPLSQQHKEWHPPADADQIDVDSMNSFPTSDPPGNY